MFREHHGFIELKSEEDWWFDISFESPFHFQ